MTSIVGTGKIILVGQTSKCGQHIIPEANIYKYSESTRSVLHPLIPETPTPCTFSDSCSGRGPFLAHLAEFISRFRVRQTTGVERGLSPL